MRKEELIEKITDIARVHYVRSYNKEDVKAMLAALSAIIEEELLGGGEVPLGSKVGRLKVRESAERQGRNPRTGETITIPATRKVIFSPAKELKDALKNSGK